MEEKVGAFGDRMKNLFSSKKEEKSTTKGENPDKQSTSTTTKDKTEQEREKERGAGGVCGDRDCSPPPSFFSAKRESSRSPNPRPYASPKQGGNRRKFGGKSKRFPNPPDFRLQPDGGKNQSL
eukprot:CAMPEP_0201514866 /NCGR_PEP_ID=MMETSP0161_2-20130828/6590_1 /ASSEMBLY_ACC=CAM_ASM_000251 /TAXON_ID=180227 /ORGANISM="Neoparamoeba aestuarina, Strain SoJaBio B1-5/56/2" /LENGTH=122 /DNA_ID=CAMNT_0047911541 /DNA_START=42 /DNA_END=407 /DNA_ORIENTATION=-